jgi:hypothetical protein
LSGGPSLNRWVRRNRVGSRIAFLLVVKGNWDLALASRNHNERDSDRPSFPGAGPKVGMCPFGWADGCYELVGKRGCRQVIDGRVPNMIDWKDRTLAQDRAAAGLNDYRQEYFFLSPPAYRSRQRGDPPKNCRPPSGGYPESKPAGKFFEHEVDWYHLSRPPAGRGRGLREPVGQPGQLQSDYSFSYFDTN